MFTGCVKWMLQIINQGQGTKQGTTQDEISDTRKIQRTYYSKEQ